MSLITTSQRYGNQIASVETNRAAVYGQRAIKLGTTKYLKPLPSMLDPSGALTKCGQKDYDVYLELALFLNATGYTVDGLSGLVFRKDPTLELQANVQYLETNVDGVNSTIINQMQLAVRDAFTTPESALLVDFPTVEGRVSKKTAEDNNLRPKILFFPFESIIKKFYSTVNNKHQLSLAVIREIQETLTEEFEIEYNPVYRVLQLIDGVYHQGLKDDADNWVNELKPVLVNGSTSPEIPIFFITALDGIKSPVDDLVDVNLNHYNMFASYANKEHSSGFPIFWESGVQDIENDNNNKVGPNVKWVSQNTEAQFGILETAGDGGSLRAYLEDRKIEMAALGAEFLNPTTNAAESGESKKLDKIARNATTADIANTVSRAYQDAVEFAVKWLGGSEGEVNIQLNTDYIPQEMNPQLLTALLASLQTGQISYDTFWLNLQKGEIAPMDRDSEDEKALIAQTESGFSVDDE